MSNIKELKQDNKAALKYLHDKFSFDFQKPVTIIKQDGKFTANTIISSLAKEIENFSVQDYIIVLLIRHYDYSGKLERLHIATLDENKINIDVPHGCNYDIGTFYSKGYLEHIRKNKMAYFYIVAQKTEYLIERKILRHDPTVRYQYIPSSGEYWGDNKGNTKYIRIKVKTVNKNEKPFEWNAPNKQINSISEFIDKSGYLTVEYRSRLMERVREYKSKKRKNEFLATDYSHTVKALDGIFETLKNQIADTIKNINTYSQAQLAEIAMGKLKWGLLYFIQYRDKIEKKEYDSKQDADSSEQNIRKHIDEINKTLREAANETDDK